MMTDEQVAEWLHRRDRMDRQYKQSQVLFVIVGLILVILVSIALAVVYELPCALRYPYCVSFLNSIFR